jgi:hypothetical protein
LNDSSSPSAGFSARIACSQIRTNRPIVELAENLSQRVNGKESNSIERALTARL